MLRDGTMDDKLAIFKILKPDLFKICCDPYGKYVANLFVTLSKSTTFKNFRHPGDRRLANFLL